MVLSQVHWFCRLGRRKLNGCGAEQRGDGERLSVDAPAQRAAAQRYELTQVGTHNRARGRPTLRAGYERAMAGYGRATHACMTLRLVGMGRVML